MDKSATFSEASKEASDLFQKGLYRKALSKFETALTAAQDEESIFAVRSWIINCYARLEEVSFSELVGLGRRADDFLFSQYQKLLRCCDELEPILRKLHGESSTERARLLNKRALALKNLRRFDEARSAAAASLKITERVCGKGERYASGLETLAGIEYEEGKYEKGLKHIEQARSLMKPDFDLRVLASVLNMHALLLTEMKQYQKAVLLREEELAHTLRLYGPDHPDYATSLLGAAFLYAKLKQPDRAVYLAAKALAIRMKTFGASHPSTQDTRKVLAVCQRALNDPELKKNIASESHRVCSVDGCHTVQNKMNRCLKCLSFYMCKKHEKLIHEHVVVCPKFPDVLPDEEELKKIVKCRRCRKESKLMKCAVCEAVWYCGSKCQKDDWKRHKVFCGKK